jgi:hypothetical protein
MINSTIQAMLDIFVELETLVMMEAISFYI